MTGMMLVPRMSVVAGVGGCSYLAAAIESVLKPSFNLFEPIVIDDSTEHRLPFFSTSPSRQSVDRSST